MSLTTKCLVTGGAGFIGSNLTDELIRQGAKVTIIDNFVTGFRENLEEIKGDFDFVEGDLNDDKSLIKSLEDVEVVFHQAALPSVPRSVENPLETHQACVNGTFNLLLKAKENNVRRVVYAASSSAYGDQKLAKSRNNASPTFIAVCGGEIDGRILLSGFFPRL